MWVLGAATLAALLLQQVSARLGLATGRDLASLIATSLPRPLRLGLTPPILTALAVTEVVEVLGVVIGVQLLTGWGAEAVPVAAGLVIIAVAAPARFGRAAVYSCLAFVGVVYIGVVVVGGGAGIAGGLKPTPLPHGSLPVAVAMIGAIVMPHNILLHSALARDLRRDSPDDPRRLLRRSFAATGIALALALLVNCAITALAARGTAGAGGTGGAGLDLAVDGLQQSIGPAAAALFALTLIAAGLASSVTGGLASADAMGALMPRLRLGMIQRRLLCLIPAGIVAASGLPEIAVLMWSQVVLTLALPMVLIPLLWLTSQRALMGAMVLRLPMRLACGAVVAGLSAAAVAAVLGA